MVCYLFSKLFKVITPLCTKSITTHYFLSVTRTTSIHMTGHLICIFKRSSNLTTLQEIIQHMGQTLYRTGVTFGRIDISLSSNPSILITINSVLSGLSLRLLADIHFYVLEASVEYVKGFWGIFIWQMNIKLDIVSVEVISDSPVVTDDKTDRCDIQWKQQRTKYRAVRDTKR